MRLGMFLMSAVLMGTVSAAPAQAVPPETSDLVGRVKNYPMLYI